MYIFVFVVQFSRFAAASTAAFLLYPNHSALSILFLNFLKNLFDSLLGLPSASAAVELQFSK
ncbi:MAG: hypothetical protein E7580_02380 [Ruminococcaceae bacterium]|nr:hypothetical protein [Oscillospiraceae bacterium]